MGLFEKKFCDICGNKIGMLGKRKLSDGLLCKDCAGKLSPWFSDRRHANLAEIREQLAYREANKAEVARFTISRSIGDYEKLLIDDTNKKFTVGRGSNPLSDNPDILNFDQALSCELTIHPYRSEKKHSVDGKQVSYQPPRYEYSYSLYATIRVSGNPYFDEMKISISNGSIGTGEQNMETIAGNGNWNVHGNLTSLFNPGVEKYYRCLNDGNEMKQAIDAMRLQSSIATQLQEAGLSGDTAVPSALGTVASPVPASPIPADFGSTAAVGSASSVSGSSSPSAPGATVSTPSAPAGAVPGRWFCPNCGTPNEGNFCINCGTKHPYL